MWEAAVAALDGLLGSIGAAFKVADEHLWVQTHGIRAVGVNDLVRLTTLPRLWTSSRQARRGDHAVVGALCYWSAPFGRHYVTSYRTCAPETVAADAAWCAPCRVVVPVNRRPVFQ